MDKDYPKAFQGSLVGFSCEKLQVKSYITLNTTFEDEESARHIKERYLIIDAPSS